MQEKNSTGNYPLTDYLPLLDKVARYWHSKLRSSGVFQIEFRELINAGFIGLNRAALTFDPGRNILFTSYAWRLVDYAIKQFLRDLDLVKKETRALLNEMHQVEDELMRMLGRWPSEEEIAEAMGMSLAELQNLKKNNVKQIALGEQNEDSDQVTPFKVIPVESEDPAGKMDRTSLAAATNECMSTCLNERQTLILLLMDMRGFSAREVVALIREEDWDINKVFYQRDLARINMAACLKGKGFSVSDL